ncbi:MAG: family 20 glycosylhydrolase [Proteobacteria bacterium]|nr:family 20 glycosylhydrolase [Pseudomonadota bacterium]
MPTPPSLPPLLPAPRRSVRHPGRLPLRDAPIVLPPAPSDAALAAAYALSDSVAERTGTRPPLEAQTQPIPGSACVTLRHGESGDGYTLRVRPDGASLEGEGPAGLRYAVETLVQLLDARGRAPACDVDDAPSFARRGILLDVSRAKVPTWETLFRVVDLCVRLKLNVLMLYVEHTFEFRRHPEIGRGTAPLCAETLLALDAYARDRHVELVPCLQSLGHMERVLSLPAYRHLAETDRGWTISPAFPETYQLLGELYDEFLPNFRSPLFNANCDEPFDLAAGHSAARSSELGPGGVYLEHVKRVQELAAAHGKRTLIWGDVVHRHPERLEELDPNLVLLDWWYEADFTYDRVEAFARAGLEFWVCPGTSSWNSLFPRIENSDLNIARYAEAGRKHGATGLLVTDWGDHGHYNLLGNSWLGYALAAQHAWSGAADPKRFDRAFGRLLFGDASGRAGRIYRRLGAIHDPGFRAFNGSPLMFLFFDDLERGLFLQHTKPRALARCQRQLLRVRQLLDESRDAFEADATTWEELVYAADASLYTVRKSEAAQEYFAWCRAPATLTARQRRNLAERLERLADEQTALAKRLRRLWLARSEPEGFEHTGRRFPRLRRSLRRAARSLRANRPPELPEREPLDLQTMFRWLRASTATP